MRVVLHHPNGAANVGAAARAIRNMGLGELVVVRDRPLRSPWLRAMAAHAGDVVDTMRHCPTLADALADCALVVGTTARTGPYRRAVRPPRAIAPEILARARRQPVALVFGPEDHGLSNADLRLCDHLIQIPTAGDYPSLNLAQAVIVCAYEIFMAGRSQAATAGDDTPALAPSAEVERVYRHLRAALLAIGFLHPDNPDHIMSVLRRLFGRAGLEAREARILLGLARQIDWFARAGRVGPPRKPRAVGGV